MRKKDPSPARRSRAPLPRCDRQGSWLLEAAVATTLLVTLFGSIAVTASSVQRARRAAQTHAEAIEIAVSTLDRLLVVPRAQLDEEGQRASAPIRRWPGTSLEVTIEAQEIREIAGHQIVVRIHRESAEGGTHVVSELVGWRSEPQTASEAPDEEVNEP